MQLTPFDRWLREKYSYETHIQVLRLPEYVPRGIKVIELPDIPGKRFQYLLVGHKAPQINRLIDELKEGGQMYHIQVVERDTRIAKLCNPKQRSITWFTISWAVIFVIFSVVAYWVAQILKNPEIQQHIQDSIRSIKGG